MNLSREKELLSMPAQASKYRTQWAAQFFAAAELTRRGYLVALTLGNAPAADLLVQSPGGQHFTVDVKGLAARNWWLVSERTNHPDFYLLVLVPKDGSPTFYILTRREMIDEMEGVKQKALAAGQTWTGRGSGIRFTTGERYESHWDALPK
jgi:hypothetical protein